MEATEKRLCHGTGKINDTAKNRNGNSKLKPETGDPSIYIYIAI